jgi:hypothetical protein
VRVRKPRIALEQINKSHYLCPKKKNLENLAKKPRYRHHIANAEVLTEDTLQNWMLSTLSET